MREKKELTTKKHERREDGKILVFYNITLFQIIYLILIDSIIHK
jgi:hypothetical protein